MHRLSFDACWRGHNKTAGREPPGLASLMTTARLIPPAHDRYVARAPFQHVVRAVTTADEGCEVARLQTILIHVVLGRRRKHVEAITLKRIALPPG
jgi:hypothetical protein